LQVLAPDNVYWAFSAAAQALAAVVAFLLAGYALVHSMMESRAAADDTLLEINEKLGRDYHWRLSVLASVTVAAILADLFVVYFNSAPGAPWWLQLLAALFTVLSFVGGVWFVISIVDPEKYPRAARDLAQGPTGQGPSAQTSAAAYFSEFVQVEQLLRTLWETRAHGERFSRRSGPPSAREMIEALRMAQVVPEDVGREVQALVRTRNLVFHGHMAQVDADQVERAQWVRQQLQRLLESA
jgi:hypothetical protein